MDARHDAVDPFVAQADTDQRVQRADALIGSQPTRSPRTQEGCEKVEHPTLLLRFAFRVGVRFVPGDAHDPHGATAQPILQSRKLGPPVTAAENGLQEQAFGGLDALGYRHFPFTREKRNVAYLSEIA